MSAVEKAAQVLAEHATCEPFGGITHWRYSCGIEVPRPTESIAAAHHAHVAQALADAGLLADDPATKTRHTCYCPGRGDNYHLSGDPGCVTQPAADPAAEPEACDHPSDYGTPARHPGPRENCRVCPPAAPSEDAATGPAPGLQVGDDAASPPSEDVEARALEVLRPVFRGIDGLRDALEAAQAPLAEVLQAVKSAFTHDAQVRADERRKVLDAVTGLDGATLITAERRRQVEVEGWTPEHDRRHGGSALLRAAEAYECHNVGVWPWEPRWWKPRDAISDLIRAGALYRAAADVSPELRIGVAGFGARRCAAKIDAIFVKVRGMAEGGDGR